MNINLTQVVRPEYSAVVLRSPVTDTPSAFLFSMLNTSVNPINPFFLQRVFVICLLLQPLCTLLLRKMNIGIAYEFELSIL